MDCPIGIVRVQQFEVMIGQTVELVIGHINHVGGVGGVGGGRGVGGGCGVSGDASGCESM